MIDDVGSVSILGTGILKVGSTHQLSCFEDIEVLYQDDVGKCDEQSLLKCVAFKWINVDKPVIANSPAILGDNGYSYSVHQYKSYGFLHPNGKTGCFVARRDGSVDFYYQGQGVEFKKVRIPLEQTPEWVSVGSIGFLRDGAVIVAAYCPRDQSLKVYKLTVEWEIKLCLPTFKVEKLIIERLHKLGPNGYPIDLDRLEVLSPNFLLDTELDILVTFTGQGCQGKTLLQKYQISNEFKNLRFKAGIDTVEGYPNLVLIAETYLDDEIMNIGFRNFDFYILIMTRSGQVQVRSRKKLLIHASSSASVSSLLDVGFQFTIPDFTPEAICVCPSMAGYVSLRYGTLQFHPVTKADNSWTPKEVVSMSAAVAYLFCSACYTNTLADELITVIQNELLGMDPATRYDFIMKALKESHRALNFSLDISKEQIDRLLVNPPMQKLLSLQYSLGKFLPTNEQSAMSLAILNLRLISFSIMVTLRTLFHQQQRIVKKGNNESLIDGVYRSECVLSTVGTINWLMEFMVYTIQELVQLGLDPGHKTIVLSLLFSTIPRSFLSYSLAGVKKIDAVLTKVLEQRAQGVKLSSLNVEIMQKSSERFKALLTLVDLDHFEKFLVQVEQMIPMDKSGRLAVEQSLVFENKATGTYANLKSQLLSKFQQHFEGKNLTELYFHDTKWLQLSVTNNTIPAKVFLTKDDPVPVVLDLSDDLIDDVTKMRITKKERLKRCIRCEYIRGDNDDVFYILGTGLTGSTNHWPVAYNRTCLCGSCWVYMSVPEWR